MTRIKQTLWDIKNVNQKLFFWQNFMELKVQRAFFWEPIVCINLFYFVTGLLKKRKKRPYCDENYFKKKKKKKKYV